MEIIPEVYLDEAVDYSTYRERVRAEWSAGRATGSHHSPAYLEYTRMNLQRMGRLDRKLRLQPETEHRLGEMAAPYLWLVLTEGWCGDAAHALPVMAAMARRQPLLKLRILLRDQHPDLMDAFLTDGGRSIPKLIMAEAGTRKVIGSWGPRPAVLQTWVQQARQEIRGLPDPEERKERNRELGLHIQKWYARDKSRSAQRELVRLLPVPSLVSIGS